MWTQCIKKRRHNISQTGAGSFMLPSSLTLNGLTRDDDDDED